MILTIFDELLDRRNNGSKKWNKAYIQHRFQTDREDIYPLFIADTDFRQADAVQEAFNAFVAGGDFGYFDVPAAFYENIQSWYRDKLDTPIEKEWIIPANGTIASIHSAAHLVSQNRPILMFTPVYGVFKDVAAHFGGIVTLPLINNEACYEIDFEALEKLVADGEIKTLLFCNPHNPSGRIWSYGELAALVQLCKRYGVTILSDEIHGELNLSPKRFVSLIAFMEEYADIIVCSSPNKTFNLSGLTASYVIIRDGKLRKAFQQELDCFHITINRAGMQFISSAYQYGKDWHTQLLGYLQGNLQLLEEQLEGLELHWMRPDAGYLVWLRLDKVSDVDRFVVALAQETGVLIETGSRFVADFENYVRLNIATSSSLLSEALSRFRLFYENYRKDD